MVDASGQPLVVEPEGTTGRGRRILHSAAEAARTSRERERSPHRGSGFMLASSLLPQGARASHGRDDEFVAALENPDATMGTEVYKIVRAELDKVPETAVKHFQKQAVELTQRIQQLQRCIQRHDSVAQDIVTLRENRVPKGMRAYHVAFECVHLDTMSLESPLTSKVEIPAGTTLRKAKEQLWFAFNQKIKEIDALIIDRQLDEHKQFCIKSNFVTRCANLPHDRVKSCSILCIPEEDDNNTTFGMSTDALEAKATIIYHKTVDREANAKISRDRLAADAAKKKDKVVEELLARKPADWLEATIEKKAVQILSKKGKGGKGGSNTKLSPPVAFHADMFVQSALGVQATLEEVSTALENVDAEARAGAAKANTFAKNGQSPSAAGGHNPKGGVKGKAPGKGGKGKGKSQLGKGPNLKQQQSKGTNQKKGGKDGGKGTKSGKNKGSIPSKGKGKGSQPRL
jgi:hypothetical protein